MAEEGMLSEELNHQPISENAIFVLSDLGSHFERSLLFL